jgi:hypothetical protein
MAVSGQRLDKHVPIAMDINATIEKWCILCGSCQDVISKGQSQLFVKFREFCMGGCEERT